MIEVSLMGAVLAGLLSFLSPCVLPLTPAYLSYISGVAVSELRVAGERPVSRMRVLTQAACFVAGFSLVFIALGASATLLGRWLMAHMGLLEKIAGLIIVVFGIHYTGLIRIPLLMAEARLETDGLRATSRAGALLLGGAFAFGWTPCVGPILGAILTIAGMQNEVMRGVLLLAAYSAGLAVPFLLAALGTNAFLRWSHEFRHHLATIEKVSGALLVLVGLLIFTGSFSLLSGWLLNLFPALGNLEKTLL